MLRAPFFLLPLMLPALAEEIQPAPELLTGPLPAFSADFAALVTDRPETTRISGFWRTGPLKRIDPSSNPKALAEAMSLLAVESQATLTLDWLNQSPAPTNFNHTFDPSAGFVRSTHNLGTTHVARTIFASGKEGVVFIHLIADKPGDLSFRTTLVPPGSKGEVKLVDRRELMWTSPINPATKAHVWVLPFESDVESEGNTITLRGEGECLLIFTHTTAEDPEKPLAGTLSRLGERHDPGHLPPDPSKIWQAVSTGVPVP